MHPDASTFSAPPSSSLEPLLALNPPMQKCIVVIIEVRALPTLPIPHHHSNIDGAENYLSSVDLCDEYSALLSHTIPSKRPCSLV